MKNNRFPAQFSVYQTALRIGIATLLVPLFAQAQSFTLQEHSFTASTYLLDIKQDLPLSLKARALREGGFETAGGTPVNFTRWYSSPATDTQITWLTQMNRHLGVIWGFSTGESAEKYAIASSIRIGFTYQKEFRKNNHIAFTTQTSLGGDLQEKTCTADYGEIGGVREVNCRLAATTLTPEETLNYLETGKPESFARLTYTYHF